MNWPSRPATRSTSGTTTRATCTRSISKRSRSGKPPMRFAGEATLARSWATATNGCASRRTTASRRTSPTSLRMHCGLTLGRPAEKARGVKLLRVGLPLTSLVEQKPETVIEKILDVKNKKVVVGTTTFNIDSCEQTPDKLYRLKMSVTET